MLEIEPLWIVDTEEELAATSVDSPMWVLFLIVIIAGAGDEDQFFFCMN